jgi:predicted glycosyltransferase involved in capsule biosynthesis
MQEATPRQTTLIVPYRIETAGDESARRLQTLLTHIPDEIAIIVVDDSASSDLRIATETRVRNRAGATYINAYPGCERIFSVGRSRDIGTEAAATEFVMFHDVDFTGTAITYRKLNSKAFLNALFGGEPKAFACIPVLFLDQIGTALARRFGLNRNQRTTDILRRALERTRRGRLVLASSALLARRSTLLDAGGHSEQFEGHGAEDFELIHRLSLTYPLGERPPDYAYDCGSRAGPLTGFRGYFARYGKAPLAAGTVLYHLWHEKRQTDPRYWELRQENFARLRLLLTRDTTP